MFLLFCLITSSVGYSMEMNEKLIGKYIVIDVGHGGLDSGTVVDDVLEKDLNLQIALKLRDVLVQNGASVLLTRDGDYDLSSPNAERRKKSDFDNRISLINNSGADLYISIHMNYLDDKRYSGAQVFYTEGNELLAGCIQKAFDNSFHEKMISNDIYMYKKLTIPGVLIECGFLSNDKERNLLLNEDYQWNLVAKIIKGLKVFY